MKRRGIVWAVLVVALIASCSSGARSDDAAVATASSEPTAERVEVPDVLGMSWIDARDTLEDAGLSPQMHGDKAGKVERQTPAGGTTQNAGAPVIVTMGAAPEPTPTPPTDDERYRALYLERGGDSIGGVESAINLAKSSCDNLRANYSADPNRAVAAMIENSAWTDATGVEVFCPEFLPALGVAQTGFYDGTHVVGQGIAPGTYTTIVPMGSTGVHDCYWERVTSSGSTISNDFVSLAPQGVTVTVNEGEGFVSDGCGAWLPS